MATERIPFDLRDASYSSSPSDIVHRVEEIQKRNFQTAAEKELKESALLFGSHMAMRLAFERNAVSQAQRPGLRNSLAGLESLTGRDETIEAADFMQKSLPRPIQSVHRVIESRW